MTLTAALVCGDMYAREVQNRRSDAESTGAFGQVAKDVLTFGNGATLDVAKH